MHSKIDTTVSRNVKYKSFPSHMIRFLSLQPDTSLHCKTTTKALVLLLGLNSNNSNSYNNVYGAVIVALPLRAGVHPVHLTNVTQAPGTADLWTKPIITEGWPGWVDQDTSFNMKQTAVNTTVHKALQELKRCNANSNAYLSRNTWPAVWCPWRTSSVAATQLLPAAVYRLSKVLWGTAGSHCPCSAVASCVARPSLHCLTHCHTRTFTHSGADS